MKVFIILACFLAVEKCRGKVVFERGCGRTLQYSGTSGRGNVRLAHMGQFPWMASIQLKRFKRTHVCGGSIISNLVILTAAHCVHEWQLKPENVVVVAGFLDLKEEDAYSQERNVHKFIVHEDYENYMRNDIALVVLKKPFNFQESEGQIGAICLPTGDAVFKAGVEVAGWGGSRSMDTFRFLKTVTPQLRKDDYCRLHLTEFSASLMTCSEPLGKDSCEGDDGGPAMQRNQGVVEQVGIVSIVYNCAVAPAFYTKVASYKDWIKLNMEEHQGKDKVGTLRNLK